MRIPAKKVLILEGLNYLACASAMEPRIQGLKGVNRAQIDLMAGKLIIEADSSEDIDGIAQQAAAVITKMEPHVTVIDKEEAALDKRHYTLKGVSCADCLEKVLAEVRDIDGIKDVSGDFMSNRLSLTGTELPAGLTSKVRAIIARIEP